MNPYDFVPIENIDRPPIRKRPTLHHKFEGLAGQVTCRITAETPIFIPKFQEERDQFSQDPTPFITRNGLPIIPGSSLKGLFRNLVETVANGCFLLFDGKYERGRVRRDRDLPKGFRKCIFPDKLCIACRLFGMLERGAVFQGNVSISDAVTTAGNYSYHVPVYTKPLMEPKPRHQSFYLDSSNNVIAGRKFYFHSPGHISTDRAKTKYNQHIHPLNAGSQFTFTVNYGNLQQEELAALLYALVLEPGMRHKIGLAKPLGFGSIRVEIEKIDLIDYVQRYTAQADSTELTGDACRQHVQTQIAAFTQNTVSRTLTALRRIWKWDPANTTPYQYPDRHWFSTHPRDPIAKTP